MNKYLNTDPKLSLKSFFVCDGCRARCKNGQDESGKYGPGNCQNSYFPRKQNIRCLGDYCDKPCQLMSRQSEVTTEQWINLVMYLGAELNKYLIKTEPKIKPEMKLDSSIVEYFE